MAVAVAVEVRLSHIQKCNGLKIYMRAYCAIAGFDVPLIFGVNFRIAGSGGISHRRHKHEAKYNQAERKGAAAKPAKAQRRPASWTDVALNPGGSAGCAQV